MSSSSRTQHSAADGEDSRFGGRRRGGKRHAGPPSDGHTPDDTTKRSGVRSRSDEDVLIAFGRLLRQNHGAAIEAQAKYQRDNDQRAFLASARALLGQQGSSDGGPRQGSFGSAAAGGQQSPRRERRDGDVNRSKQPVMDDKASSRGGRRRYEPDAVKGDGAANGAVCPQGQGQSRGQGSRRDRDRPQHARKPLVEDKASTEGLMARDPAITMISGGAVVKSEGAATASKVEHAHAQNGEADGTADKARRKGRARGGRRGKKKDTPSPEEEDDKPEAGPPGDGQPTDPPAEQDDEEGLSVQGGISELTDPAIRTLGPQLDANGKDRSAEYTPSMALPSRIAELLSPSSENHFFSTGIGKGFGTLTTSPRPSKDTELAVISPLTGAQDTPTLQVAVRLTEPLPTTAVVTKVTSPIGRPALSSEQAATSDLLTNILASTQVAQALLEPAVEQQIPPEQQQQQQHQQQQQQQQQHAHPQSDHQQIAQHAQQAQPSFSPFGPAFNGPGSLFHNPAQPPHPLGLFPGLLHGPGFLGNDADGRPRTALASEGSPGQGFPFDSQTGQGPPHHPLANFFGPAHPQLGGPPRPFPGFFGFPPPMFGGWHPGLPHPQGLHQQQQQQQLPPSVPSVPDRPEGAAHAQPHVVHSQHSQQQHSQHSQQQQQAASELQQQQQPTGEHGAEGKFEGAESKVQHPATTVADEGHASVPAVEGEIKQEAGGEADGAAADGAAADTTKAPSRPRRVVRNQRGRLVVKTIDMAREGGVMIVRPKANLFVDWEVSAAMVISMSRPEIGLFRMGLSTNQGSVIAKELYLPAPPRLQQMAHQMQIVRGSTPFYAPRSVGTFVFRMYDSGDDNVTHATSAPMVVELQGAEVEQHLRFVLQQFRDKKQVPALSQLAIILRGLKPFKANLNFPTLLWSSLTTAVQQLEIVKDDDSNGGARLRAAVQLHVASVVEAALKSPVVAETLSAEQRIAVSNMWKLWSPFTEDFFQSEGTMKDHYNKVLGFVPSEAALNSIPKADEVFSLLSREIETFVPSIMPSESFYNTRESVRSRVEALFGQMTGVIPPGSKLRVFGSSANGFGSDSADLDMCMAFPRDGTAPTISPSEIIDQLAEKLKEAGMVDVVSRSTARIPIVLFKDESGLDCDISVENPLALRNTQLLLMYSRVDPRVRYLAYVVKHWARRRRINNPSESTLSSYAYVLLVIHFLQTRNPPLVPNLQLMPPTWAGEEIADPELLRPSLPQLYVLHPIDKTEIDTYFWTPPQPRDFSALNKFAARNRASLGSLLVDFFRYYTWEFDFRDSVVSVRSQSPVRKDEKAEREGWPVHTRLSVEDPFEAFYDVAHVLHRPQHCHIRLEFARAYTLCCREGARLELGQSINDGLLAKICEEAPAPAVKVEAEAAVEGQVEA